MRVPDKVLVVTGAGSGIGRELSLGLLSRGALVAGVDLDPASVQTTGELASRHAGPFAAFAADVSQRSAVEALPEKVLAHFGRVDGIINNAGVIQPFCRLNDAARIFVGKDAAFMDKLYRLSPSFAARAIARKMRALLPA